MPGVRHDLRRDLSQAIRGESDQAFAAFGARFFVRPNPMYGSWERN